jgi:hypothetical protein
MVKIIILKFGHNEFHKKGSATSRPAAYLLVKFSVLMCGISAVW